MENNHSARHLLLIGDQGVREATMGEVPGLCATAPADYQPFVALFPLAWRQESVVGLSIVASAAHTNLCLPWLVALTTSICLLFLTSTVSICLIVWFTYRCHQIAIPFQRAGTVGANLSGRADSDVLHCCAIKSSHPANLLLAHATRPQRFLLPPPP